MEGDKVELFKF